jgi:subfamily B ATP-binding cassette protein MsbA
MNSKKLYFRLLRYVIPYWFIFALVIVAIVVMAVTEPILAATIQPLLDGGFVEKNPTTIQTIPIFLMLLILVKGLAMLTSTIGMTWVASRLVVDLRTEMFDKILSLPTIAFDNTSTGVLLSKVTYDVNRVMAAATDALIILVRDSLAVLGLLAWMFYLNWKLSLIIFAIVPVIIITVRFVSKRLRRINSTLQETMGDMTRILEEAIVGHKLVKVFGGHDYEQTRFEKACRQVRQLEVKTQVTSGLSVFIIQILTAIALGFIIYIATLQSAQENISVGSFVSLFTAMGMLFAPVKRLTKINEQLQQGLAAAQSVFALIDRKSEIENQGNMETLVLPKKLAKTERQPVAKQLLTTEVFLSPAKMTGKLTFERLSFTYPGQTTPALQEINLTISPGETVALVGASGSGKTTLAHLIPRFYPITTGALLLDEININQLPLATLRATIALVSQEVVLFNDTIAANIAYGALASADQEEIISAAQAAYAMEFIEQMPRGLETWVGERGVKLSGGQRQRLAIARALLKTATAPILILDEATSALDTHSERQVQQALAQLKPGRTIIIIAHRLSTIEQADRIIVMERGRVVEMGKHEQLLQKGGVYARLSANQTF